METTQQAEKTPIPVMKPWLGAEEAAAAAEAVSSGWVAQGPRVAAFEQAVAARVGANDAVALTSCTTALHMALVLLGIEAGDEVIVPSLSFIATANCVRYTGATPTFADVEVTTQNVTAETIERAITPATKAVIVVHQTGTPADLDPIRTLCDARGIAVVEDAACGLGSTYKGQAIGSHSDLIAFSFHPRKVITTGEGGMLTTTNLEWAARARRLREHGMSMSAAERHNASSVVLEQYLETGFNYRMTDVQAAIGLVQLGRLDDIVERRRALAAGYHERLAGIEGLITPNDSAANFINYQSFWALLPEGFPISRNELLQRFMDEKIGAKRGIMASHLEPAYGGDSRSDLPVTERISNDSVILPLHHYLTEDDQDRVVDVIRTAATASRSAA
jgi:dTDP-4-amino-4,6-dideoxygalactose transaminase